MKQVNKQRGLSSIGWLFVGVTIFLYATILTKVAPIYLADIDINNAMKDLSSKQGASAYAPRDIINALKRNFDMNNVRDLDLQKAGVITITKDNGKVMVEMNYEKVASIFKGTNMLQNMDIVVRFKHTAELK